MRALHSSDLRRSHTPSGGRWSLHHISTTRGGQNGIRRVTHGHPKMASGLRKDTFALLARITLDTLPR
jgi:hypothetical protein